MKGGLVGFAKHQDRPLKRSQPFLLFQCIYLNIVFFVHSLVSDWNHGNAHFLRGVARALMRRGHTVRLYEQRDNWSKWCLVRAHGEAAAEAYREAYPDLHSEVYEPDTLDVAAATRGADLILVHEFNMREVVAKIGRNRPDHAALLFHDTHHRGVTKPREIREYDLSRYDGVLAFGEVLRVTYLENKWTQRAWTWHEAADITVFHPMAPTPARPMYDLVWIGNWGDEERTAELHEFLLRPVKQLGLRAKVYGVRYPEEAVAALREAGIEYGGYLPNHRVPGVFADARMTVHVPRRPYVEALPGIPTIRPFEALACGIALIGSPWEDREGLFRLGEDFLMIESGDAMQRAMVRVLCEPSLRASLIEHGLETIRLRHTCDHRGVELLGIAGELGAG